MAIKRGDLNAETNEVGGNRKMRCFKFLQVVIAVGILLTCVHVALVMTLEEKGRAYAFIYQRSSVQHLTLLFAAVVIVLLFARLCQHRWSNSQFKVFEEKRGAPPKELAQRLDVICSTYDKHGVSAAASRAERVAESYAESIQKAYETINFLAGTLPALGLFGTMLGLSNSLFVAFAGEAQGPASVRVFVTALSTAMDTTVLAMACAVPLFGAAWLLARLESDLGARYTDYVRKQFGLDEFAAGDKTSGVLHSQLQRLTKKIAAEVKLAFAQLLEDSAAAYRETLEQVAEDVFVLQREHDTEAVKRVAAEIATSLGHSVNRVGDLMERQNGRLAEGMIHQVGRLEKALRNRTPEEVVIRYQHNGHATKG